MPPDPLLMTALHFVSRKSYTRVVSSSKMRTRFEAEACDRRGGVEVDAWRELDGGDHATRDVRTSWLEGIDMLRMTSNVTRHRISRRAPARLATCDAVGDGTDREVATTSQDRLSREGAMKAYICTAARSLRSPCCEGLLDSRWGRRCGVVRSKQSGDQSQYKEPGEHRKGYCATTC
jgi:hypothetical protein